MKEKVEAVLIRQSLQTDRSDFELVDVSEGTVRPKLTSACADYLMATMTLRRGIERVLKEQLPDVKEVIAI